MMNVVAQNVATVKHAEYREVTNPMWDGEIMRAGSKLVPPTVDVLYMRVDYAGEDREMVIVNGEWSKENATLQFLAYCDAKPSDLEPVIGTHVQVVEQNGNLWPTDTVLEKGAKRLEIAGWFNENA